MNDLRILFLGESWYGSCARACAQALRRLGANVLEIDVQTYFPQVQGRIARAGRRAVRGLLVREYNRAILAAGSSFRPDLVLAFKGAEVKASTLRTLGARGISLYNYYPDTSAFAHGSLLAQSLPEYDVVFHTKKFWTTDVSARLALKRTHFVPHGYDPEVHRPMPLTARDREDFGCDVSVIATHTAHKEKILHDLLRLRPALDLRIWGNGWHRARSTGVLSRAEGHTLQGASYAKAIAAAKVNLALLSGVVSGSSQGDETTTRTYEIPACGGFMLHERTPELCELFEEGKEVTCYGDAGDIATALDSYLADPDARAVIAERGHARAVPRYAYDARMQEILAFAESHR